jgi:hypothetical protein
MGQRPVDAGLGQAGKAQVRPGPEQAQGYRFLAGGRCNFAPQEQQGGHQHGQREQRVGHEEQVKRKAPPAERLQQRRAVGIAGVEQVVPGQLDRKEKQPGAEPGGRLPAVCRQGQPGGGRQSHGQRMRNAAVGQQVVGGGQPERREHVQVGQVLGNPAPQEGFSAQGAAPAALPRCKPRGRSE